MYVMYNHAPWKQTSDQHLYTCYTVLLKNEFMVHNFPVLDSGQELNYSNHDLGI